MAPPIVILFNADGKCQVYYVLEEQHLEFSDHENANGISFRSYF